MQRDFEFAPEPGAPSHAAPRAVARLAACGDDWIALPPHTTLEIVEHPQSVAVPGAAPHALGLMQWQGRRIALIDAAVLLRGVSPRTTPPRYALVLALQPHAGAAVGHGAIALDALPESVTVSDDDASAAPDDARWQCVALSCFIRAGRNIPVVDTAKLFAQA